MASGQIAFVLDGVNVKGAVTNRTETVEVPVRNLKLYYGLGFGLGVGLLLILGVAITMGVIVYFYRRYVCLYR